MMRSESSINGRSIVTLTALFAVMLLLVTSGFYTGMQFGDDSFRLAAIYSSGNNAAFASHRKLLNHGSAAMNYKMEEKGNSSANPERIWSDMCSASDLVINQGATEPLPNGIPTYTVEIMNVCTSGCDISGIHLTCGWFSSARMINPHVFKRLKFDDCLVNDGKPLLNGRTLSFQYANTFRYPLFVSAISC